MDFAAANPVCIVAGPRNSYTLYFSDKDEAEQACALLASSKGMLYAELDTDVSACTEREISFRSWGATRMHYGQYLQFSDQWGEGSVTVAVIDSGIFPHPLLADRITESGYDYVDADEDATDDPYGHGTNVAGILADCTSGEAVYFYPIRVLNSTGGGSSSNVANAIREATAKGVQIINLSLEASKLSQTLDDAILDAVSEGVTVVVAAGNKAKDTSQYSPSHLQNSGVIVVGSAEADGSRSSYSNYGTSVDVYAHGTGIQCCSNSGGYTTATGTSMAAPHVSALSALLLRVHPEVGPAEIEERIARAAQESEVNVPDLQAMVPEKLGFYLQDICLPEGVPLTLPVLAFPDTAMEAVFYLSSDNAVVSIENGVLTPVYPGTAVISASCTGFDDCSFSVSVASDSYGTLNLPASLSLLEDEAFSGIGGFSQVVLHSGIESIGNLVFENCPNLAFLTVPDTVMSFGENTFSGAVLLCPEGSAAEAYAVENSFEYILY